MNDNFRKGIPALALLGLFLSSLLLSACNMIPSLSGVQPTVTTTADCGCTVKGTRVSTPTGGLVPAGPAGPSPVTPSPASLDTSGDRWETYSNADYGFSFEYPAAYTSQDFGFCKAREAKAVPQGAVLSVNLGSRTTLTLTKTNDPSAQSAAEAFRGDPANKDVQFDAPTQRTVGGVPAVTLPYHSGGTNRYAEATFFVKDGTLYRIDTGAPSACDVPALNLTEMAAYAHMLDSFKFR